MQALAGATASDARGILLGLNLLVSDPDQEFFTDAAEGTVVGISVAPRAGGDAVDCTQGCTALEGDTATISVSVGPVPDVSGMSIESAAATLGDRGLSVAGTVEESSDDFDAGQVIYIAEREGGGSWRPGESVTLVVSSGPELFPVPNIVGLTRDQAKAALTTAGFEFEYATPVGCRARRDHRGRVAGARRRHRASQGHCRLVPHQRRVLAPPVHAHRGSASRGSALVELLGHQERELEALHVVQARVAQ